MSEMKQNEKQFDNLGFISTIYTVLMRIQGNNTYNRVKSLKKR